MPVLVRAVDLSDGELPADLGLPVDEPLTRSDGGAVESAPLAAGEAGAVEEDARVADEPGAPIAVLLEDREAALLLRDVVELPLRRLETLRVALDPLVVGVVPEVGAV